MVLQLKRLADQQLIPLADTPLNLVTNPAGAKTVILSVFVKNNSSEYVKVKLYYRPDNQGEIGLYQPTLDLIDQIILYPNGQHGDKNTWEERREMEDTNDSFWIEASVANVVNVFVNGLQEL